MTEKETKPTKRIVYKKPIYAPTKEDMYVSAAITSMPFLNLRPHEIAQRAVSIAREIIKYQKENPPNV